MDTVNVLVNDQITEDVLPRIQAVDPRVRATHVGRLLTAELEGDAAASRQMDTLLAEAEVYAGMRIPARLLSRAPQLKWLQVTQAGVDRVLLDDGFRRSPIQLSNVGGVHSFAPAEQAMQFCLAWAKGTVECARVRRSPGCGSRPAPQSFAAEPWVSWGMATSARRSPVSPRHSVCGLSRPEGPSRSRAGRDTPTLSCRRQN